MGVIFSNKLKGKLGNVNHDYLTIEPYNTFDDVINELIKDAPKELFANQKGTVICKGVVIKSYCLQTGDRDSLEGFLIGELVADNTIDCWEILNNGKYYVISEVIDGLLYDDVEVEVTLEIMRGHK